MGHIELQVVEQLTRLALCIYSQAEIEQWRQEQQGCQLLARLRCEERFLEACTPEVIVNVVKPHVCSVLNHWQL